MLMLYFSGTGNSKHVAEFFSAQMNIPAYSIEDEQAFADLIAAEETIGFCYPVYGSRVPKIMRNFVAEHSGALETKKLIIFCTQASFSGDGARAFAALLPKAEVIYAEHFFMPNNFIAVATDADKIKKTFAKTEQKILSVCEDIKNGKIKKRGFNIFSRALGLFQGIIFPVLERRANKSIQTTEDCNRCRVCVSLCPMKNLLLKDFEIVHKHNCTVCFRCVNKCPKRAITVLYHGKVKKQYRGRA